MNNLMHHLTLKELIEILEEEQKKTPGRILKFGFGEPDSWRGDYYGLMFTPKKDVTIDKMLQDAKGAVGAEYYGYKGGCYKMGEYTDVWLDYYGEAHEVRMCKFVLNEMLK